MATGTDSRAGKLRIAFHVLVGVASWAAFAGLWVWQLGGYVPAGWLAHLTMLGLGLVAYSAFTGTWIWWNRNIFRRRHRRFAPVRLQVGFDADRLGRQVVSSKGVLLYPSRVFITVDDATGVKSYEVDRGADDEALIALGQSA